jgi:hypothetical protein
MRSVTVSRSNPTVNAPNPAARWYEWNGELGVVRHYDKDEKKNIEAPKGFTFMVLDELASVGGWHDASESGIYSNAVRDTRTDVMVVKAFKGGTLAEGLYKDIKDRVAKMGGHFVANCYIAAKIGDELKIAGLKLKGSALGAWMEFRKDNRKALYEKAVQITGCVEGKKGRIVFRTPTFALKDIAAETNSIAVELDKELQDYLTGYLQRKTSDRADEQDDDYSEGNGDDVPEPLTDDDIPFAWVLPMLLPVLYGLHSAIA